ncbi:dihydrofolate reductase family protein [Microlunatus flavus]|uniref:Dihydrofolate reductase n=1 Tax=Microlunatus flavus TaxID=1036181 RepID=A0A1H9L7V4_9ACTN|nr:dihydrofolate reductase family protein [Microlunatus flavus]SER07440.1 Dihydrofolate reductase [Microlunatus flavus]
MSKLLYSATMSLDGFIAGPDGDMSWLSDYLATPNPGADLLMDEIGSLLVGRRTHTGDDPNAGTEDEGAFGGRWVGPVVVLSRSPERFADTPGLMFSGDVREAVAAAKDAAAGRYVNVLGAGVARSLIEADLLDEVMVFIAPFLLGDGVRLFDRPGGRTVRLEPVDRPEITGPTGRWFEIARRS